MYCTYLTIYKGNKLPPFYIGHAKLENIENGYVGSVSSKKYKETWKRELKESPHLFSVNLLKFFDTKADALSHESKLQKLLHVHKNPMYVNMAISNESFYVEGPSHILGTHHTDEVKQRLSEIAKKQFEDPAARKRHLDAFMKKNGNHANKIWINNGQQNRRVTNEVFQSDYSNWAKGRLLGDVKFYEHNNKTRDKTTGRFIK